MEVEETEVRVRNEVSCRKEELAACGCWTRVAVDDDEEDSFSRAPGDGGDLIDVLIHWDWHMLPMLPLSHSISVPCLSVCTRAGFSIRENKD